MYIFLVLGPAENTLDRIIQFFGVAVSLLSVVKGISEYHLYTAFNINEENPKPVNFFHLFKSSTFFLPHTLFRSFSIAVISAFIGYYAFIPFTTIFVINAFITFCCTSDSNPVQIVSLVTSFFTPSVLAPGNSYDRGLLKRSTIVSTMILLASLITIFFLPTIFPNESALLATPGLHHLNFDNNSSRCNLVCGGDHLDSILLDNITTTSDNITLLTESINTGQA